MQTSTKKPGVHEVSIIRFIQLFDDSVGSNVFNQSFLDIRSRYPDPNHSGMRGPQNHPKIRVSRKYRYSSYPIIQKFLIVSNMYHLD